MKVIYVNLGITPYAHTVLEKLSANGCELVMLLPKNDDGTIGKGVKRANTDNRSYKITYSNTKRMWYGKPALTDMKSILIQEEPDILMIGWPYFLQLFFDMKLLPRIRKLNIKLIIQEIPFQIAPFLKFGYYRKHPVYNENMALQSKGLYFYLRTLMMMFIRKFVYKHAAATINYASVAYDILPSYGVKKESIFVRYNSTDTETLFATKERIAQLPPILQPRKRILHIGRLVKWKRIDLLLDAYKKIAGQYPDSELTIIGDGPEKESLVQQTFDLGLTDRVVFAGAIYDSLTLGQYMNESTIYVLAGMGGLSINDAMSFSLPVICSVCDGTEKDLVTDGVNGYFFKTGDANDLATKIKRLLSDTKTTKKMGAAGCDVIKNKININTVVQRYMDAFEYVMGN